jgi:hypothetical protein
MYWLGPFIDLSGKPVNVRTAWAIRLKRFAKRIWTVRKGKYWIANSFFTLWVATDVLALIKGTTPLLPLSVWGAIFGSLLVSFEWWILVEDFKQSAPLHVLWQPRISQSAQERYLYVYFESKNDLPFEVRCTFANGENIAMAAHPPEYQEFVPTDGRKQFAYQTKIPRALLDGLKSFRLHVEIAPLLAHPKLHDHWVYSFVCDEESGKFKRGSGCIGVGVLHTQTWWYPQDQDEEWLRWEKGL